MVAREAALRVITAEALITLETVQQRKRELVTFATNRDTWRSAAQRSLQALPEEVATPAEVLTLQGNAPFLVEVLVVLLAQLETATSAINQDTSPACVL